MSTKLNGAYDAMSSSEIFKILQRNLEAVAQIRNSRNILVSAAIKDIAGSSITKMPKNAGALTVLKKKKRK